MGHGEREAEEAEAPFAEVPKGQVRLEGHFCGVAVTASHRLELAIPIFEEVDINLLFPLLSGFKASREAKEGLPQIPESPTSPASLCDPEIWTSLEQILECDRKDVEDLPDWWGHGRLISNPRICGYGRKRDEEEGEVIEDMMDSMVGPNWRETMGCGSRRNSFERAVSILSESDAELAQKLKEEERELRATKAHERAMEVDFQAKESLVQNLMEERKMLKAKTQMLTKQLETNVAERWLCSCLGGFTKLFQKSEDEGVQLEVIAEALEEKEDRSAPRPSAAVWGSALALAAVAAFCFGPVGLGWTKTETREQLEKTAKVWKQPHNFRVAGSQFAVDTISQGGDQWQVRATERDGSSALFAAKDQGEEVAYGINYDSSRSHWTLGVAKGREMFSPRSPPPCKTRVYATGITDGDDPEWTLRVEGPGHGTSPQQISVTGKGLGDIVYDAALAVERRLKRSLFWSYALDAKGRGDGWTPWVRQGLGLKCLGRRFRPAGRNDLGKTRSEHPMCLGTKYAPEESDINAKFNIFQAEAGENQTLNLDWEALLRGRLTGLSSKRGGRILSTDPQPLGSEAL
eukprot:g24495.t1